jgi:hypothetical protein
VVEAGWYPASTHVFSYKEYSYAKVLEKDGWSV